MTYQIIREVCLDVEQIVFLGSETDLARFSSIAADLGDYNPDEHLHGYLADLRLVPNQTEDLEAKIAELHRMHR